MKKRRDLGVRKMQISEQIFKKTAVIADGTKNRSDEREYFSTDIFKERSCSVLLLLSVVKYLLTIK